MARCTQNFKKSSKKVLSRGNFVGADGGDLRRDLRAYSRAETEFVRPWILPVAKHSDDVITKLGIKKKVINVGINCVSQYAAKLFSKTLTFFDL